MKYVDLYKQLESKQINPILRELVTKIYHIMLFKTVSNLTCKLMRIKLMKQNKSLQSKGLPSGTVKGYEIFDEASNLGVTENSIKESV